jgi:uncharacterized protein (DUF2126 family)
MRSPCLHDRFSLPPIGGCVYNVAHPGGRAHATYPKNALEAEGRRVARFQPFGHTPGKRRVAPVQRSGELPSVLDLRMGAAS